MEQIKTGTTATVEATEKVQMSKIKYLHLKNFMGYSDTTIDFGESNIINLCGYNSSGKSAIIRALDVILYNSGSKEHVKYIKDGENEFSIELGFDDGIIVRRHKSRTGQSVWEMEKNAEMLWTNKTTSGTFAVEGVPDVIQKYFGVLRDSETKEKLNLRRITDKMFLINTTGGENYKILSEVLKADVLSAASKAVISDKNRLQTEEFTLSNSLNTLKSELNGIEIVPDTTLEELKVISKKYGELTGRNSLLTTVKKINSQISEITIHDELTLIDINRVQDLEKLRITQDFCTATIYDEISTIDVSKLEALQIMREQLPVVDKVVYDLLPVIDTSHYDAVISLGEAYNNWAEQYKNYQTIDKDLKTVQEELSKLAKETGFKICKVCGTIIE